MNTTNILILALIIIIITIIIFFIYNIIKDLRKLSEETVERQDLQIKCMKRFYSKNDYYSPPYSIEDLKTELLSYKIADKLNK